MSRYSFWRGLRKLSIADSPAPERPVKLCAIDNDAFVLTASCNLYRTLLSDSDENRRFERVGICAVDVATDGSRLFYVDVHGRVFKCDPGSLESRSEIPVKEDGGDCVHGHKNPARKVKIKSVAAGRFGVLYVDESGRLWASGCMPQLNVDSAVPSRVQFFEGRSVYRAAVGENFAIVSARKSVRDDDESESEDVFVSACAECEAAARLSSPGSQPSSQETCPLGVQMSKSSEDTSSASVVPSDKPSDPLARNDDSSSSTEDSELTKIRFDDCTTVSSNPDDEKTEDGPENDEEKRSVIFINTEAAKQFLTRQLSWVSAGEDYLVECTERPTRIIKENVSNLTNLVVVGVRTVGDKVVTLSRHMSGGSENNEAVEATEGTSFEEPNPMMYSLSSSGKFDELQASSSTVSDKDQAGTSEKVDLIVRTGQNLLNSEVWVWGSAKHGQLGTGDALKRSQPVLVSRLANLGVLDVRCGKTHCAALTLDGRAFLWGENAWHQVTTETNEDKSSPRPFVTSSDSDRVRDISCGDNHTLVFTLKGNLFFQGHHGDGFTETVVKLNDDASIDDDAKSADKILINNRKRDFYTCLSLDTTFSRQILASGFLSYYYSRRGSPILQDLTVEQRFLEESILIHNQLIKPLLKKTNSFGADSKTYESLCGRFTDLMYFTAVNVLSFWRYTDSNKKAVETALIQNNDEHLNLYRRYLKVLCDVMSVGGFQTISTQIEGTASLQNLFNDKLPSSVLKNNRKMSENIVNLALTHPLRLNSYKCIIQSISRYVAGKQPSESKTNTERKLSEVLSKWEALSEEQEKRKKEADLTKFFWDTYGRTIEAYKTPNRRLIRESKSNPLSLHHSGRFSSHWFILFNDTLIHINGSIHNVHDLGTLWVESIGDSDTVQNGIQLITPEEAVVVTAPTSQEKNEWFQTVQSAIKNNMNKSQSVQPPIARTATYTFTSKSQTYKDAVYSGRWSNGKMHGYGKINWPDGRYYQGQFYANQIQGKGKMETPNIGVYEGQWKDNLQNGFGVMKYCSGDVYEGYFKDGLAHGYGVRKQGDFKSATATVYMGDWNQGFRHGYGVMCDIGKGEKYLGNWNENKKHGYGLIVTFDGIYYEGIFANDILLGHGIMIFEDGTHYEGDFKCAGIFNGKGTLTFSSGDKIEGMFNGAWTDGIKINNATLELNVSNPTPAVNSKPTSFGKLCVPPNQKWNGLFRQCFVQMCIPESYLNGSTHIPSGYSNRKVWQNVAVLLSSANDKRKPTDCEQLNFIPTFGQKNLTIDSYGEIRQYLSKACELPSHPLESLMSGCSAAFCASYGGVRVHPLLLSHAVAEFRCIATRIYSVIHILFPALPAPEDHVILYKSDEENSKFNSGEVVSVSCVVQPLLLPRIHSSLHVLYALHHQSEDVAYWKRLLKWNRQTDVTLMSFLGIDQKFWINHTANPAKEHLFSDAIDTLQQLKTTFSPMEKLLVIKSTFEQMTLAVQKELGQSYLWTMDELFPVFHFVVVRAQILQLGSEIHFIEDFLEPCMQNGELGLMFTTLKACYHQILQEKIGD